MKIYEEVAKRLAQKDGEKPRDLKEFQTMLGEILKEKLYEHLDQFEKIAREIVMRDGYHSPMLFYFGNRDDTMQKVDIKDTWDERMMYFFKLGEEYKARVPELGFPMLLFFLCEGWGKSMTEEQTKNIGIDPNYLSPSKDLKNRVEVLMINGMIPTIKFTVGRQLEYVRENKPEIEYEKRKIIEIKEWDRLSGLPEKVREEFKKKKGTEVEASPLNSFMTGFVQRIEP